VRTRPLGIERTTEKPSMFSVLINGRWVHPARHQWGRWVNLAKHAPPRRPVEGLLSRTLPAMISQAIPLREMGGGGGAVDCRCYPVLTIKTLAAVDARVIFMNLKWGGGIEIV